MRTALWNFARIAGYKGVVGNHLPTAKNQQVANLYDRMGFSLVGEGLDGSRAYRAELDAARPYPRFFEVFDSTGATRDAHSKQE